MVFYALVVVIILAVRCQRDESRIPLKSNVDEEFAQESTLAGGEKQHLLLYDFNRDTVVQASQANMEETIAPGETI
jgi:hypothetical protein